MKILGRVKPLRWAFPFAGLAAGWILVGCTPEGKNKITAKGKPPAQVMKNLEDPAPESGTSSRRKGQAPGRSIKERIQ